MTDLISRQEAIDLFKRWQPKLATNVYEFGDALLDLPPAQRWIPVEEGLPKDGEYVLVCADKIKSAFGPEDCRFLWRWVSGYSEKRVSAWMPLPEPYEEENNERV